MDGWKDAAVFPGIPAMLRSLKACGAFLGVVTAKPTVQAERVLKGFGLIKYFDRVASTHVNDDHCDKAEMIRRALPEKYRRACMVGDRMFDMAGAVGAGVDGIGALYGYGEREELVSSGAAATAESVEELTRLLLGGLAPEKGCSDGEGPDGCGKSTLRGARRWQRSRGTGCETREPGAARSPSASARWCGREGAGHVRRTEALLFAASRAQHVGGHPPRAGGATPCCATGS